MPDIETPLIAEVYDQLQRAMAANPAGFTELYRDYLADAWQTLQTLREAVRQHHREEICATAHYLKSSSLVLGARRVARHATMLEETARKSDIEEEVALERIAHALREVQDELAVRLGGAVIPAGRTAA